MTQKSLDASRDKLDQIDAELVRILLERLQVSGEIGVIKAGTGQPVHVAEREDAVLEQVYRRASESMRPGDPNEPALHIRSLMRHVMRLSREYQYDLLMPQASGWEMGRQIEQAPAVLTMNTVAVQGGAGSYQSMAAFQLLPAANQIETETFAESCARVQRGEVDCAVLPLENTTAGTVDAVYDLLLQNELYVTASASLPIVHCLMALRGTAMTDIRTVHSHPQALLQCADTIREQGWQEVASLNTAYAAREIAVAGDRTRAAIGSREAARAYGLEVLTDRISNSKSNQTRFVLGASRPSVAPDAGRVSLILRLADRSGTLSSVLNIFADRGLNLAKIQSRPMPERPWEYCFYLDFEARADGPERTLALVTLYQLEQEHPFVRFLGWYVGS
ncbi:MAG: ACT domain-containing protein [Clostridiaceae bacterium]|nr:ACT domain-containing protein [Clostridiaceae bacterium]